MRDRFPFLRKFSRDRATTVCWVALCVVAVNVAVSGCHLGTSRITASPLSYSEQKQAVLDVVPVGTSRDEAMKKLAEAGIEGSAGVSDSIYYCDMWKRDDGSRWHMNVALFFDPSDKLYEARPAQAATSIIPEGDTAGNDGVANQYRETAETNSSVSSTNRQPDKATANQQTPTSKRSSSRNGRRTSFVSPEELK